MHLDRKKQQQKSWILLHTYTDIKLGTSCLSFVCLKCRDVNWEWRNWLNSLAKCVPQHCETHRDIMSSTEQLLSVRKLIHKWANEGPQKQQYEVNHLSPFIYLFIYIYTNLESKTILFPLHCQLPHICNGQSNYNIQYYDMTTCGSLFILSAFISSLQQ